MKNVVLVIDSLIGGGAENMNVRLAELFTEKQYTVHLIILKNIINFEIDKKVHVSILHYEKKYFSIINKLVYANKLKNTLKEIEQKNGKIDFVLGSLGLAHDLMNKINVENFYYVLHGVTTIPKLGKKKGISKLIKKYTLCKLYSDKNIICVSNGVKDDILTLPIKPKSIRTIYNFFDFEQIIQFSNQDIKIDLPEDYIIHVGRFAKVKRHDLLIKAFSLVKDKNLHLVLLGDGEEKNNIIKLINQLNLSDRVKMLGFQDNPYPFIKNAKALVLSSDNEGFGNVLVESLIVNTIVISTDCPVGPREILGNNYKQCLAKMNDEESLALCIENNLNNPPQIKSGELSKFNKHAIIQQYEDLLIKK